jgi:hypothetical protein
MNQTVAWMALWVCINLTVTARKMKLWYLQKFAQKKEEVEGRALLLPGVL